MGAQRRDSFIIIVVGSCDGRWTISREVSSTCLFWNTAGSNCSIILITFLMTSQLYTKLSQKQMFFHKIITMHRKKLFL